MLLLDFDINHSGPFIPEMDSSDGFLNHQDNLSTNIPQTSGKSQTLNQTSLLHSEEFVVWSLASFPDPFPIFSRRCFFSLKSLHLESPNGHLLKTTSTIPNPLLSQLRAGSKNELGLSKQEGSIIAQQEVCRAWEQVGTSYSKKWSTPSPPGHKFKIQVHKCIQCTSQGVLPAILIIYFPFLSSFL